MPSSSTRRTRRIPAWVWPACRVLLAAGTLAFSWSLRPEGDDGVSLLGRPLDQPCPYLERTGDPCPNCGATRAILWTGRGRLLRALSYHPAGTAVMMWALLGGVIGARRLLTRRHDAWKVPWQVLVGWALLCMLVLYVGVWVARLLL